MRRNSGFPFVSMRTFLECLERTGDVLEIDAMNQDRYELTAFLHKLWKERGLEAPAIRIKNLTQGGRTYDIPVVTNLLGNYRHLGLAFGAKLAANVSFSRYYADLYGCMLEKLTRIQAGNLLARHELAGSGAPCKETVLIGSAADLFDLPVIQHYPVDAGRYITTGMVILEDPELGANAATCRIQVQGPRKANVYFNQGTHSMTFCERARRRGQKVISVAVAIGVDPVSWVFSGARLCGLGVDELAAAGTVMGWPFEVTKCETSDLRVPAHAEFVLEGTIDLERLEPEGPFMEVFDRLGYSPAEGTHVINITALTHRAEPIYYATWMGCTPRESSVFSGMPFTIASHVAVARSNPNIVRIHRPAESKWHLVIISIDKKLPGDGMQAALSFLAQVGYGTMVKIAIVVDRDVNPASWPEVLDALASNWQPVPGSLLMPQMKGWELDHTTRIPGLTSKIIIDATRQFPEEGGPERQEPTGVEVMRQHAADAVARIDEQWQDFWRGQET